jgi:putative ATPase
MKDLGYGKGYRYAHDYREGYTLQRYLPEDVESTSFYTPTDRGYEKTIGERIRHWQRLRRQTEKDPGDGDRGRKGTQ